MDQQITLFVKSQSGRYQSADKETILNAARAIVERDAYREAILNSPDRTREFLKVRLGGYEHEIFYVIFLDNRHRVIGFEELSRGTIDGASVYPREVVKSTLKYNAAAVIFAHNHPSGVAEPSHADRAITTRLVDALKLVDVRVLDHFVVGTTDVVSFAERGLI